VMVSQGLGRAGAWAAPLAALTGIVAAVAAVSGPVVHITRTPPPPELKVPSWVVGRPTELTAVVRALVSGQAGTVGITTGLYGAGGFGKTTLAQMVCADRRVRRRFGGRIYVVTVGRDVRGPTAVAAKVNEVIKFVFDENVTFTDPQLAGRRLGSLLDSGPRSLLVLDDVWEPGQLAPFAEGGRYCARLVTTRVPDLVTGRGTTVLVDQMSRRQAQELLTRGLPGLDPAVATGLLEATGRWPLLLRLVNRILSAQARVAPDVSVHGAALVERLRIAGPAVVDDLLGDADRGLDVGQPDERARAVRATIGASTSLLDRHDADRFAELGVFAEDEVIPFHLVASLWRATGDLDELQAGQLCYRLGQLALVAEVPAPGGGVTMHDVVRDFLRAEIGRKRLAELNGMLLNLVGEGLPAAELLSGAAGNPAPVAWWELRPQDRYLWDHLIEHLRDSDRPAMADIVACDLRWLGARLKQFGPAAPTADLSAAGTPRTTSLRAVLVRAAHLLAPTEPADAVIDVLHSRVADDPDWGPQVVALRDKCHRPRLVNRWSLPDLADPALQRVLGGHANGFGAMTVMTVAPDGSWLVAGGRDGTLRIWDPVNGAERGALTEHAAGFSGRIVTVAIAPDSTWLAAGGADGIVRIWDPVNGTELAVLGGHKSRYLHSTVQILVAPDGSWLAGGGRDGRIRIWDAVSWKQRTVLVGQTGEVTALAAAPDGSWLASSGGFDRRVRIWDAVSWKQRTVLVGQTDEVTALAAAPDGSWLASGSQDDEVRIWDPVTGTERAVLTGHGKRSIKSAMRLVVAPDGSWLASGSADGTVRIWDAASWKQRAVLTGAGDGVIAMATAPGGGWLASGSADGTVRIWDAAAGTEHVGEAGRSGGGAAAVAVAPDRTWLAAGGWDGKVRVWDMVTGTERAVLTDRDGEAAVVAAAVAPDGSWLASGSADGTVRIWDVAAGTEHTVLTGHSGGATAVAVAPDSSWLAAGSGDGKVRIWDVASWKQQTVLTGHNGGVAAIAVAPDGSWLAAGGWQGSVRIWNAASWTQRTVLAGYSRLMAIAVATDGSWLAAGSRAGRVRIWDLASGNERAVLTGHTGGVTAIAVAPGGSWLASASADGTVRLCDPATGQARALMRLDNRVSDLAWLSTSVLVVAGSAGLYLFDVVS
jgi:WD40 repeat protein